jgi:uncharacterized membrane protein YkvA (DUF1232 family)
MSSPYYTEALTQQLHEWQARWKPAIERWVAVNRDQHGDFARMVEHLPDLVLLAINLIKDPSLPDRVKDVLVEAAEYVFNGGDILPEEELGVVGLVDDAIRLGDLLNEMIGHYTPALNVNWSGKGDVLEIIEYIVSNRDRYIRP